MTESIETSESEAMPYSGTASSADIHSCSPFCRRPECVERRTADKQPDALRLANELNSLCVAEWSWSYLKSAAAELRRLHAENEALWADAERYRSLNTPEVQDFIAAVEREALHQRDRWAASGDAGKTDADWFWLIGYLAGKALHKPEKQLHHIITTAAACLNWHGARTGNYTLMRPGIDAAMKGTQ